MRDTVFMHKPYDNRIINAIPKTELVIECFTNDAKPSPMLGPQEILDAIEHLDTKAGIARVLDIAPPRVTELYKGMRKLSADEAKKLFDHYKLGKPREISVGMCRLLAIHAANQLGLEPTDQKVQEIAQDFRAFLKFASSPDVETSIAEGFLAGLSATQDGKRLLSRDH